MAALQPAVDRIKYLITKDTLNKTPYQGTPDTITGNATEIWSYGLRIAAFNSDTNRWTLTTLKSSPTTNRHINAAYAAIYQLGYAPLPEDEQTCKNALIYGLVN